MFYGTKALLPMYSPSGGPLRWLPTRYGNPIVAVVIHRMDGVLYGTDGWFRNYRESGVTSTHFGVGFMSVFDKFYGRAQIRQWVDTNHTAFGWNARPSDVPTPLAKQVFGSALTDPLMDMNRLVIHIEVEGFSTQQWHPAVTAKVRELLGVIGREHGNLWVVAHADLSVKPCPGLPTWYTAMPGVHGTRLGGVLPDTALPEDNLPNRLRFFAPPVRAKVKRGKAIRQGRPSTKASQILPDEDGEVGPFDFSASTDQGEEVKNGRGGTSTHWLVYQITSTPDKFDTAWVPINDVDL